MADARTWGARSPEQAPMTRSFVQVDNGHALLSVLDLGRGTFTANGTSAVDVADTAVTSTSMIFLSMLTPGGTVGAIPAIQSITAGVGFQIKAAAGDTSIYAFLRVN